MDHLVHFEDLLFEYDNPLVGLHKCLNILWSLHNGANADVTIKYDGAPALVYGVDADNRFFLTTKSYFNKTPLINYSIDDIDKNHWRSTPELRSMLKDLFTRVSTLDVTRGHTYFGDLIKYNGEHKNLLSYEFEDFGEADLVIANHHLATYDWPLEPTTELEYISSDDDSTLAFNSNTLTVSDLDTWTDNYLELLNYKLDRNTPSTRLAYKKSVNKSIRSGEMFNLPGAIGLVHLELSVIKNGIIEELNRIADKSFVPKAYLNGKPSNHEGFVIHSPGNPTVKFVNRREYSYLNFRKNG